MAEKMKVVEDFLTCSVCLDTFKEPVSLGCNHSFCFSCLQDCWEKNQGRNCPLCRRKSSKGLAVNFALKELCRSFTERLEAGPSVEAEDRERDVSTEKVVRNQQDLQTELQKLKAERRSYADLARTYDVMERFCKKQAEDCERVIKVEFSRLHTFLQEEEQRTISALRQEQLRQKLHMDPELQKVREKLNALSDTIQELETHVETGSCSPQTHTRLRPKAGLLLDQAKVIGNLGFRVWSNMRSAVSYSPVIMDPNTADESLYLSEDLRAVRQEDTWQKVPDNPERFSEFSNVLGWPGFSCGRHQWDVKVGDHPHWNIGAVRESVDRKTNGTLKPEDGLWALNHRSGEYSDSWFKTVPVESHVQKVRVKLDYEKGELSFYDADRMTHLYTYTDSFTETILPYFYVIKDVYAETTELRILPCDPSVEEPSGTTSAFYEELKKPV